MDRLAGKVALVTGAGGGIGGAGAEGLGREGAAVYCTDVDAAVAEATAARIRAAGGKAAAQALDVRDRAAVDAAVAACVAQFGRLDVLVECAGIAHRRNFLDLDAATWDRVIAVNLTGMFHLGQAAARQMVKQGNGGSIINITSQLAEVARPERAAYIASKGGGRSLTHAMAIDLAAHDIRVNAIAPGPTATEGANLVVSEAAWERRRARTPLGRLGTVADVANAAVFLASEESSFVTGDMMFVDGGITYAFS